MEREIHLSDDRLLLRPVQPRDASAFYAAVRESIAEISPWMSWCTPDYSLDMARDWAQAAAEAWASGAWYAFAILSISDSALLGGCTLRAVHPPHYRMANLSYWVRSSRARQGIASAAARLAARFAFERLGLVRVEIVAAVENRASQRVAEKSGSAREGILRNRLVVRERIYDAVMHSLVPADFGLEPVEGSTD